MKPLGLNEIREKYLSFFEARGHLRLPSASLLPKNDASLLLINSGMAPLKPYFTGRETPPRNRAVSCQKCIRTIDIDRVGMTSRHGTFFEMLGNFSFGDYFKEDAIRWAWEFMTEIMKIDKEKLSVSVYEEDDEAYAIWRDTVKIPENRIVRLGKDDNFWEVGTGPCGPCSEIYFDRGEAHGCGSAGCAPGCDCDRFVEIWNLVFTQFEKKDDGAYDKLLKPNIDTGMGLERISAIMQGAPSLFDVDTIKAIRDKACSLTGLIYGASPKTDISVRIITDHIRSVTFLTADGVMPSNEGAGYVLRRLLRRAAMRGRLAGCEKPFLSELADTVIAVSADAYPILEQKHDFITSIISNEETRFNQTISQGMELLDARISAMQKSGQTELSGDDAFRLYDTYGFPLELTKEILAEKGFTTNEDSFSENMKLQKQRARDSRGTADYSGSAATVFDSLPPSVGETIFVGYDTTETNDAKILAIIKDNTASDEASAGESITIILDKTPFYAESGGQKGDIGIIKSDFLLIEIHNTVKVTGSRYAHIGKVISGVARVNATVACAVDFANRSGTAVNHTATHLLQKALSEVLGAHVEQAGSAVSAERLRFDFTHFSPLSRDELQQTEDIVNQKILADLPVNIKNMPINEARKAGAIALFGEKYGDIVRVVNIGGYSTELCGGTHLASTGKAGLFKIVSETGISAGVRRIEALTGKNALEYYKKQEQLLDEASLLLKTTPSNIINRIDSLNEQLRAANSELQKYKTAQVGGIVNEIVQKKTDVYGVSATVFNAGAMDMNTLRKTSDMVREKFDGVIILACEHDGKCDFLATASEAAVKNGVNCGSIVKAAATVCGGGGGGKPSSAQAGGKQPAKINEALASAFKTLQAQLDPQTKEAK